MKPVLSGTGVALVTPFIKDGMIDYDALARVLAHVSDNGADYLVVMGTTGEPATLAIEEKSAVLNFIRTNNEKKLPIVYGIGGNNTTGVLEEIKRTDLSGVEAILSVSPYYNKPSQTGIIHHFETVANECPVPVILYNVPGRTASNMTAATTLHLARHNNIIGIKEASGDFAQAMTIISGKPDDFLFISGDDLLMLPFLSIGGDGVISVMANAYPKLFRQVYQHFSERDMKKAAHAAISMADLHPLLYEEGSPAGIKFVLSELGFCEPKVRLPMAELSDSLKIRIRQVIESM